MHIQCYDNVATYSIAMKLEMLFSTIKSTVSQIFGRSLL